MKREGKFQNELITDIKRLLPGCIVMKNDPDYIQGIPDLTVLHKKRWACLEVKRADNASHRPNQDYYIHLMNDMSFAAFVCPENKDEVLSALSKELGNYEI